MPLSVVELSNWLQRYKKNVRYLVLGIVIIIISFNFGRLALISWQDVKQYALPDTRDIVSEWLVENTIKEDKILLEGTCNYPKVPFKDQAVFVAHLNAYPSLNDIDVDYIIINKSSVDYLYSKKVESSYQVFFNELKTSKKWKLIYTEKGVTNKSTGPEIFVYSFIVDEKNDE